MYSASCTLYCHFLYIQDNLRWRQVVPPSNPRKPDVSATRGRRCETDCCREKTVSKVSKKKGGHSSERVNVPTEMASSRRMRHPEPSIGPYWIV
ncbi:hypothetical protein CEXT_199041 [Caerostris extrusa]|uniref:Uncharacterized protein n=1 Tax=Caerostris extrusa TaxID=172846 RepID=A0AAV4WSZ4_CAEEX|nr:hypothetical protein CEXT_199041 [Caerostris extrusa]